jgi:hypothetical protein
MGILTRSVEAMVAAPAQILWGIFVENVLILLVKIVQIYSPLDFIILHPFFIEWDFKNITL